MNHYNCLVIIYWKLYKPRRLGQNTYQINVKNNGKKLRILKYSSFDKDRTKI